MNSRLGEAEKEKLLQIITKYKNIIENKKTDSISNRAKKECWDKIGAEYNAQSLTGEKTTQQLKAAYMNMKGKLRKTLATQKQYTSGTGGGPALAPIDEAEGLLYDLVAPSVTARPNWFDDDGSDDEMPSCELPTEYLDDSFIESNCDINTTNSPPIANNLTQNTTPLIRNIPNPNENNPTTSRNPSTTHNTAPPLNNSPTSNFPRTRNRRRVKSVDNKIKEKQLEAIEERIKLTKLKQKAAKAMYLYYKNMGPPQASSDSD